MDNILDKFGLYDFFSALLPGMFFIIVLIFINFPLLNQIAYPDSDAIQAVAFVLFSYIIGGVMQEIGSLIDKRAIFKKSAIRKILSDKDFSIAERDKVKEIVNKICKKENVNQPDPDDCESAFFVCKGYLECEEKMEKENKLDSIYALSRDLIICNGMLILLIFVSILFCNSNIKENIIYILILLALSFVYYGRAKRYSAMRVRSIFRKYIALKNCNKI